MFIVKRGKEIKSVPLKMITLYMSRFASTFTVDAQQAN
jgi:hypothetical protein